MSENKSVNRFFLALTVIYVGVSLGIGVVCAYVPALANMSTYASILLSQALILVPGLFYCKWKKLRIGEFIPYRRISLATVVLVVVCTYLMYPLIIVLNAVSMLFSNTGTEVVMELTSGQSFLLNALFTALLPACVEEFMFRGVLFQTYRKSKMLPAILLSAFLFGCMHMNLNQFVYAFALGVYLAFLVEATGSIVSSMVAHFTLNFTSVVMSFLLPVVNKSMELTQSEQLSPGGFAATMERSQLMLFLMGVMIWAVIAAGTTCGAVAVYIAICKINKRWDYVKHMFRRGTRERMITIPLVLAVLILFAVMGMRIYLEHS